MFFISKYLLLNEFDSDYLIENNELRVMTRYKLNFLESTKFGWEITEMLIDN